ncbi:GNAT family N-acetyltransferase [Bacillus sp. JJ1609]|uniref:GNAT family N-acetyltransferase n=1 Tax=Bacillus sp. JJ1609 TaxID=3122977 RepID=UPI002FFF01D9
MELWNVYDQYRQITDRIHERGQEMKDGDYHIVVHVWIMNDKGEFLIQKRQPWKKGWSNMWDCSAAGSAILGDNSEMAAVREAKEELGIDLDIASGERLFTVKFSCGFDDIWLVRQNIAIEDLSLQEEEVADAKWASEVEIKEMFNNGEFIPFAYLDLFFEMAKSPISLWKASIDDAEELLELQKEVFKPLYQKYNDHETSPVTQTMERFLTRFERGDYYKITYEGQLAGSVNVYQKTPGLMRLHIINIREEYHNRGIAQKVMARLELMYPEAEAWELGTILSEERNCYLYEKMGYEQQGDRKVINDKMTLVSYRKEKNIGRLKSL